MRTVKEVKREIQEHINALAELARELERIRKAHGHAHLLPVLRHSGICLPTK